MFRSSTLSKPRGSRDPQLPAPNRGFERARPTLYHLWRRLRRRNQILLAIIAIIALEWVWHVWSFRVSRPQVPDRPFFTECQEPNPAGSRENAVIVMLARNKDASKAAKSVASFEEHFNRWYNYPIVFLNDEPWDKRFIDTVSKVASGETKFEVIGKDLWTYPDWIDQDSARKSMKQQQAKGMLYAGRESYHHMCRFNSGKFYDHPALLKYRWFWRLDSDIEYTCAISYDPFSEMAKHGKKYGYAMALWERGDTAPTLFREVDRYRKELSLPYSALYTAMTSPSWGPMILRRAMSWLAGRNDAGDAWNHCHFWSNFEIGDLDFFRGKQYREFFEKLDRSGGFYFERWGDAPVHSFGAALLLKPQEVHYFEDIGYVHDNLQHCPSNAKGGQLPSSGLLGSRDWDPEGQSGIGCRCRCNARAESLNPTCQNVLGRALY